MARRSVNTTDLIPIYYRIPFGYEKEIVSGYLEKKHVDNGKKFYGHFRCEDCGHKWRSGNTWQGYRQECRMCEKKNWPEKVYHLEQSTGPITTEPHREDLCEKCQELGYNCKETHGFGGIGSGRNNKFDQCFNKQFELWRYNILLEPRFIQDLYDSLWNDLNPSDRSEFKDALEFALGNWKTKGNDDQITACEDLLCQIEDASQRKSRTRKRSASSNKYFSPTLGHPGAIVQNTRIPLNNDFDALLWYDEENSPRSSLGSGSTALNQPIESSPRPTVWKAAQVKRGFNQTQPIGTVHPVQMPVTKTNHRDEHSTPQLINATLVKPKTTLVPQPSSNTNFYSVLSQTNNSTTAPSNNNLIVLPHNNPIIQLDNNPSSRPNNIPAPQPNNNPSSRRKNNPAAQPSKNPSSCSKNKRAPQPEKTSLRPKNNPAPQPNNNPSPDPNNSLTVESDEDPVRILSMLTVIILAVAMLVYFTVL